MSIHRVARYEVISLLGAGGMGTVYRARLTGPGKVRKEVALKLLHPHLCRQRDFVDLFLAEMRLAMMMTHRNIVHTFDAGVDGERHYMVMELVDGCSLRTLLQQIPAASALPPAQGLFVVREVAAALHHAHGLDLELTNQLGGVIHQDVCPNNVLLSRQGEVKLADFGVARAATVLDGQEPQVVQGKLRYMAPEQARGQPQVASDIFALGAMMYELLQGASLRPPGVSLRQIEEGEDLSGSTRAPSRPGVTEPLVQLVQRCTDPTPGARPTAAEVMQRLDDALQREAVVDHHSALGQFVTQRVKPMGAGADHRADRMARLLLQSGTATHEELATAPPRRWWVLAVAVAVLLLSATVLWLAARTITKPSSATEWSTPVGVRSERGLPEERGGLPEPPPAHVGVGVVPRDAAVLHAPRVVPDASHRAPRPAHRRWGWLEVNAVPWATVYVNGRRVGDTPLQGVQLRPGTHRVRLVNPVLRTSRQFTLRIRGGQRVRRVVVLHPR